MKKTPLYEKHTKLNGKIIDFGGWALPVEYSGIIPEHQAVRTKAGLFDVSHMGEIKVKGKDAEKFLQMVSTNDISVLKKNQIAYTAMCYTNGGVIDDLLVYKYGDNDYLLVVNASNTEKDFLWLKQNVFGSTEIEDVSENYALLALQGPLSQKILQKVTKKDLNEIEYYYFCENVYAGNIETMISRTGYTGEDGFELYIKPENAEEMWELLLKAGREEGLLPCGLGARDTLRFEAALPLYGNELSENISPLEAGLGFFVKLYKDNFIGKEALLNQKASGVEKTIVGFEMIERGIPRSHYEVFSEGRKIGYVTTGSYSPTLKKNIGLALVDSKYAIIGEEIEISVRNKHLKAAVVKKPFYTKKKIQN